MKSVSPDYPKNLMAFGFSSLILGKHLDNNETLKRAYMLF